MTPTALQMTGNNDDSGVEFARRRAQEVQERRASTNATLDAVRDLAEAVRLIDSARVERLRAGDRDAALRLDAFGRRIKEEADVLDGHANHGLPLPTRSYSPGATIGWLARHDAVTRANRRAFGLPVPGLED